MHSIRMTSSAMALATALLATGCAVGPTYQRPTTVDVSQFKEAQGWVPAAPADALERGPWWQLFGDAQLNTLASQVEVSNQNIAAAVAAYAQARAVVREQRSQLFPTVSLDSGASRTGSGGGSTGTGSRVGNNYQLGIGASWEPDVWGRLGRAVDRASASAQASAADLAAARLSAQGELAVNYLSLRQLDAQKALLASTLEGFQRTLTITQNRYNAGISTKTDLLQAQSQLASTQAEAIGLERQRAQLEHAIAVLVGQAPSNFSLPALAAGQWQPVAPEVPVGLPSTLLQRRPDIAAAERRVAVANEQIGIARSAYYPSLSLSASGSTSASRVADLFSAGTGAWALGLSAAQVLFNAGATTARVDGAQAAHEQAVARYRQTVLVAFADVEDQLAATRVLAAQQTLRQQASQAADQVEQQVLNRYRAGQVSFTEVITAQATALSARRTLVQAMADRQTTAVALIQSLGGGWMGLDTAAR